MSKIITKTIIALVAVASVGMANANVSSTSGAAIAPVAQVVAPVSTKVNINTASAAQLASGKLKGIGLAKAKTIIAYRTEHGKFNTIEELAKVKGIGPKLFERNRDLITAN